MEVLIWMHHLVQLYLWAAPAVRMSQVGRWGKCPLAANPFIPVFIPLGEGGSRSCKTGFLSSFYILEFMFSSIFIYCTNIHRTKFVWAWWKKKKVESPLISSLGTLKVLFKYLCPVYPSSIYPYGSKLLKNFISSTGVIFYSSCSFNVLS